MKRCPECQFLYENETNNCDMDGTPLRYTVALPMLPGLAKSIWDKWTIALLSAVILGTVFVILYRATPRAYTSSSPARVNSTSQEMSKPNQNEPVSETETLSDSSETEQTADAAEDTGSSESQSAATAKLKKLKRSVTLADDPEPIPAQVNHFEPPSTLSTSSTAVKPSVEAAAPEKSPSQTASQISSSTAAATAHPRPPDNYSSKPATENQKKESGLKSFFKKAGKAIKKPFGDN